MSTEQLKALRDAAARIPASVLREACDLAIAPLEAAEQPKPCAGFRCGDSWCSHSDPDSCLYCGNCAIVFADKVGRDHAHPQPSAERKFAPTPAESQAFSDLAAWQQRSAQPSAEQAQQPAPVDVPPMPYQCEARILNPKRLVCPAAQVADLHAACVRIAAEREAFGELAAMSGRYLNEARRELEAAHVELAALKGQEPVATVIEPASLGDTFPELYWFDCTEIRHRDLLYAAPVPPPDSVPLAQHEAALAEARRDGLREALVTVNKHAAEHRHDVAIRRALIVAADGIRALADAGGEG